MKPQAPQLHCTQCSCRFLLQELLPAYPVRLFHRPTLPPAHACVPIRVQLLHQLPCQVSLRKHHPGRQACLEWLLWALHILRQPRTRCHGRSLSWEATPRTCQHPCPPRRRASGWDQTPKHAATSATAPTASRTHSKVIYFLWVLEPMRHLCFGGHHLQMICGGCFLCNQVITIATCPHASCDTAGPYNHPHAHMTIPFPPWTHLGNDLPTHDEAPSCAPDSRKAGTTAPAKASGPRAKPAPQKVAWKKQTIQKLRSDLARHKAVLEPLATSVTGQDCVLVALLEVSQCGRDPPMTSLPPPCACLSACFQAL